MNKKYLVTAFAISILLLSVFHSLAFAGTFTAFGPKTFVRGSGKPVVETASFNIKNPDTAYTIHIYNGGLNSEYSKASSAVISLNGITVFSTNDFNQQVTHLQKNVSVATSNVLQVELRSSPGSGLTILIKGEDNIPPDVTISSPSNNTYLNTPIINVSGTASDSISWVNSVAVNGAPAQLTGESLTASNLRLIEGSNTITATATDTAGNTNSNAIAVMLDTIPPKITIDSIPSITNNPQRTITGKVEDASPITSLTINGKSVGAIGQSLFQFTTDITLSEGLNTIMVTATDKAGNTNPQAVAITLDTAPPAITLISPTNGSTVNTQTVTVTGTVDDVTSIVSVNGINATISNNTFTAPGITLVKGANIIIISATDSIGNNNAISITITYARPGLPDPATVAPQLDNTVATTLVSATAFLYTGNDPIQTGVAPGTIEAKRAAVLRGKVTANDGTPLSGVKITILNHFEYGSTKTREDGMFDVAVNGGGWITVNYEKTGYLPVQRKVDAPWQDYAWLPEIVMLPFDTKVTTIDLNSSTPIQVAQGNPVTDADGTRTATILFPSGNGATMLLPDGSWMPLSTVNVRATEYTVGDNGPKRMPGALPSTSGYTYAVEYSLDEAVMMGAKYVSFSKPVISYTDNFLNFPVGGIVPVGWYDREKGAWIPSDNGKVIKILSITNGMANLDIDGSCISASSTALTVLGITDNERKSLATLYQSGKSLWRVPISHFTPWDCNWPYGPPDDATDPKQPKPEEDKKLDTPTCKPGSIIECENQTLGESVNVAGTPFTLNYKSDRVPGRKAAYTLNISISGATVPASLKRIDLEIEVAGRKFTQIFSALPNQTYTFTWDGKDAYGRKIQGAQPATIRIGFAYQAIYQQPAIFAQSFGAVSGVPITGNRARQEITLWQEQKSSVGPWDERSQGIGGWSLNVHYAYDPVGKVIYLGNGERRSATNINLGNVITNVAGIGTAGYSGDGAFATSARLNYPYGVAVDSVGNLYFADSSNHRIRKITANGYITTVAGNGSAGYSGDGAFATSARLNSPYGVAVDSVGNLYFADLYNHRVRKIGVDGIITTVAGNGTAGFSGDGGFATNAQLRYPTGVAVDSGGSLYIADLENHRIRKVGADGLITTVAYLPLYYPYGIAVARKGDIYIACTGINFSSGNSVFKINSYGIITKVAGEGYWGYSGDGGLATNARLYYPFGVAVDNEGNVYIADYGNQRIRKVSSNGIITTVAGSGSYGYGVDVGLATSAKLKGPSGVAMDSRGNLYISDTYNHRIRKVFSPFPDFSGQDFIISSEDGKELYGFDATGKHLKTVDATTGTTIYSVIYDASGYITAITDRNGNVTAIERDSSGSPTAIIAPGGQQTELSLDANGYLISVTNPNGEAHQMTYTADGLLTTFSKPKGSASILTYDSMGLLIKDEDQAGGFKALSKTSAENGKINTVTVTTAEGRTTTYVTEELSTGASRRTNIDPSGLTTITNIGTNGTKTITAPDGTITTTTEGPDPRFGMQAPVSSSMTVNTPGGKTYSLSEGRTVSLSDTSNPLSIITMTDTTTVNGKTFTSLYDAATKKITATTPVGRKRYTLLDTKGRVSQEQTQGINTVSYGYDDKGRLTTIVQGTRTSAIAYDSLNQISNITDASGRTVNFNYDLAGRVTQQALPDGQLIGYTYDANGNVTSIIPPGRPAHNFTYDPRDLETYYNPPDIGIGTVNTQYAYNLDKQLTTITRPDGQTISLNYDNGGRLSTMVLPTGQLAYSYSSTTGNLSSVAASGETLSYSYDGSLLTGTSWTGSISGSVGFVYNNDFRVTSESVNGANSVSYSYDNDGLLTGVGSLSISHDSQNGLITGSTLGSVTDSLSYSSFGEPSRYTANYAGSTLLDVQYTRDSLSRITSKTETVSGQTNTYAYIYDQAGRLTDVSKNGTNTAHYDYDTNGNRVGWAVPTGSGVATYDNQDRLVSYGSTSYSYTANGELLSKTNAGQTISFNYDVLGNLKSATLADGTAIEYVVDGQNRRIGKKVNGALVQGFLYKDQLKPVAELDGAGNAVFRFIYGNKPNVPEYMVKGGITYRIITDHLGSPRLVVNASTGAIAQQMDYNEFGSITNDTNPGFQPFGFAGGLYDRDTKLVRFGARDYDPSVGRFLSKDPLRFKGGDTNLYGYVTLGDPINFIDPKGELLSTAIGATIGTIGGAIGAIAQHGTGTQILTSAIIGGISGGLAGSGIPAIGTPFGSAILSSYADLVGQLITNNSCQDINWSSIIGAGFGGYMGTTFGNLFTKLPGFNDMGKLAQALASSLPGIGTGAFGIAGAGIGNATGF